MSNIKFQKLFIIFFLGILLFPLVSLARSYQADGATVTYEGLVPCGKIVDINGTPTDMPCQFCHFFVMIDAILDFVITMAFIIAVLMIVFAGFLFIVAYLGGMELLTGGAKGGPKLLSQAKKTLTSVATGLLIIFAAWIIVNTIFVFLGVADWTLSFTGPGKWSQMNCPIELPE